jgi:cytochrome oxidase Cu insertion factor (SCO1/SenC/PrrC family)
MNPMANPRAALLALAACLWLAPQPASAASNPFDQDVKPIGAGEPMPAARFVDERDRPFTFAALRGQVVVVVFIYTRCQDACPIITAKFAALDRALGSGPYHLVEMTIDPVHDTPAALRAYARKSGAGSPRWDFVTGRPDTVSTFARAAGLSVVDNGRGDLIHNARLLIVSQDGRVADVVELVAWDPATIAAQVRHVAGASASPLARVDFELTKAVAQLCGGSYQIASGIVDVVAVLLIVVGGVLVILWLRRLLSAQGA